MSGEIENTITAEKLLYDLLTDVRQWASTAANARNAMQGTIISVPLSSEMIAVSKAQERTLRGIEDEIKSRMEAIGIKF